MNARDYLKIAPFVNDCPNCGSEMLGNVEGTLNVDDNLFTRTCKCGFKITIDSSKGTTKSILKKTVEEALNNFRNN